MQYRNGKRNMHVILLRIPTAVQQIIGIQGFKYQASENKFENKTLWRGDHRVIMSSLSDDQLHIYF